MQDLNINRTIEDELRQELEVVKFALQVEEHDNEYNCAEKDKLKEEIERLRALTEWQPIDDKAKSGDSILIAYNYCGGIGYCIAYWTKDYNGEYNFLTNEDVDIVLPDEIIGYKLIYTPYIEGKL